MESTVLKQKRNPVSGSKAHRFYSIGQVSRALGLPSTTIRYWERVFRDLWQPARTPGGQRRYSEGDIAFLRRITELSDYMKLESIRTLLETEKSSNKIKKFSWDDKVVLVTGGTGSFGKAFVKVLLERFNPRAVRIYSRDELKQFHLQQEISDIRLRFFIGDVRDRQRLIKAARGADVIIHAAAMKQVPACEYNPFEAVKTNVMGAKHVIDAALENEVPRVIALSTDKAVNPVNLYGATKLCADKMFIHANVYSGDRPTRFSCVRYGNVLGSRGSVVTLFLRQRQTGEVTITDPRMTRFWLTISQAVDLVIRAAGLMKGGEIFIPRIPSMKVVDLARAIAPGCRQRTIGIRPGEKLHEVLINEDEGRHTLALEDLFIVKPNRMWWNKKNYDGARPVEEGFQYCSHKNDRWLGVDDLKRILRTEGIL